MNDEMIVKKCAGSGASKILFSCHRLDYDLYFETLKNDILEIKDCTIYCFDNLDYYPKSTDDYYIILNQFDLIVIPISFNFIIDESRAKNLDFHYAIEHKLPLLPILVEPGLYESFNQIASIQVLDRTTKDETQEVYKVKLKKYIESVLVDDETAQKIKDAFDAYIFLSYRKKDRLYAQKAMSLIHKNEFMRDIAIWYDEFLTPGENFNDEISKNLIKSKVMALLITPNINEKFDGKGNYVIEEEYPAAIRDKKPVIPLEAIETNKDELKDNFKDISDPINMYNNEQLEKSLQRLFVKEGIKENNDPTHLYFIGLAYLFGIDVERNNQKGLELLDRSSSLGCIDAALFLSRFYQENEYYLDYDNALKYAEIALSLTKSLYEKTCEKDDIKTYGFAVEIITNLLQSAIESKTGINQVTNSTWEMKNYISVEEKNSLYKRIENINKEYWDKLKKITDNKTELMDFMHHRFKTEQLTFTEEFIDEIINIDHNFISKETSDYLDFVLEIAQNHDFELFSFGDGDIDKSLYMVAIEKSKQVSNEKYFETLIHAWNFFNNNYFDDVVYDVEEMCKTEIMELFRKNPIFTIKIICNNSWFIDDEFCYNEIEQISTEIQKNINEYVNDDPVYSSALIEFFDKRREREAAKKVLDAYINKRKNADTVTTPNLMKLILKWDSEVPFYETILNLVFQNLLNIKKENMNTFIEYIIKTYQSDEANKSDVLTKIHDLLNACLNHNYEDDLIGKYNTIFYIAEKIPMNHSSHLLEEVIEGYRRLIGEQGKTKLAEERYHKIKQKLTSQD